MNCPLASFVLLASLNCFGSYASAAGFDLPANGWASWQVPAVADAPAWCCLESSSRTACKLDDKNDSHMNRNHETTDTVRLYVHFTDGKADRLRPLSADCPVQTASEIRNLSPSEQTSVEWLSSLLKDRANVSGHLRTNVLVALAVHSSPLATRALISMAENKLLPREDRKQAIFWLAQSGTESAFTYLDQVFARATQR